MQWLSFPIVKLCRFPSSCPVVSHHCRFSDRFARGVLLSVFRQNCTWCTVVGLPMTLHCARMRACRGVMLSANRQQHTTCKSVGKPTMMGNDRETTGRWETTEFDDWKRQPLHNTTSFAQHNKFIVFPFAKKQQTSCPQRQHPRQTQANAALKPTAIVKTGPKPTAMQCDSKAKSFPLLATQEVTIAQE